jgi:hypothetical protein
LYVWWLGLAPALWAPSPTDCPEAATVEAKLRETLGFQADAPIEERVSVEHQGEQLRVTARGKDDRLLGERLLPAQGNCEELAGAVAVVLAAWISDEHPEYLAAAPAPEAPPEPSSEPPTPPMPPPAAPPTAPSAAAAPPRDEAPASRKSPGVAHRFGVGAALGVELSSDGAVPLGAVGARWMPERWGLGGALTAVVTGSRRVELSNGSVRYFRWPLVLGPAFRFPIGATSLDLQAGAALAWLHLEGIDYSPPQEHDAFSAGGALAARLVFASGLFRPFAELSGVVWGPTEAVVRRGDGNEVSLKLPRVEGYAVFGAAWQAR